MADFYKIDPLVFVGVPTLQQRPISWEWADAFYSLQFPLGASRAGTRVHNQKIAEARNEIAQQALNVNADWVLFVSDDVIPPPNLFNLLWRHRKMMTTGVYWTKNYPKQPYVWRDMMKGSFTDWKYGEFFKIDWAGCDALLVHTDVFRKVQYPWFSHEWRWTEAVREVPLATEDLYFYTKARQAGFELWCDTEAECGHQDRATGMIYGLDPTMPQHKNYQETKPFKKGKLYIADVGAGCWTPYIAENAVVKRFDIKPDSKPDIVCDIRAIPEKDNTFDMVMSHHVLEHFFFWEVTDVLKEWIRILKINGRLQITVPNMAFAARELLKTVENPNYDAHYAFGMIWGTRLDVIAKSEADNQIHKMGFTEHGLRRLLEQAPCLAEIEVKAEGADGEASLTATAKKIKNDKPWPILSVWNEIHEKENNEVSDIKK